MTPKKTIWLAAALALLAMTTGAFAADPSFDVQLYRPSIFGGNFVAFDDAHNLAPLCWGLGLYFNYADRPLVVMQDDEYEFDVTNSVFTGNLTAAFAPTSWMALGVDIPVHLTSRGRSFDQVSADADKGEDIGASDLQGNTSLGDVKAEIKFVPLDEHKFGVGLAIAPYATFPTGDPKAMLGEGTTNFGGRLILEKDLWGVINVSGNGGYFYRAERDVLGATIGSGYLFGAGVSRKIAGGLSFSAEYWGQQYHSSSNEIWQANPMEATVSLRYLFDAGVRVLGAGGPGMGGGAGSPNYRLIAGLDYFPCSAAPPPPKPTPPPPPAPPPPPPPAKTTLTIRVVDKITGALIPNAKLKLIHDAQTYAAASPPSGQWQDAIAAGDYYIQAEAEGYEKATPEKVKIATGDDKVVTIPLREVIVVLGKVLFDYDSDVIKPAAHEVLDKVASVIQQKAAAGKVKKVVIGGHASAEGTDQYNLNLSQRRAESVRKYLVAKGVNASLLHTVGYGETKPVTENETEAGRSQNRRVEFVFEE